MIDVRAVWDELVREGNSRTVYRNIPIGNDRTCALGYTPHTRIRFLQLEIPSSLDRRASPPRQTQAVQLERVTLTDGVDALFLFLQEPALTDVFTLFVDDVLQYFNGTNTAEQAAVVLQLRLEHWQQLFAKLSSDTIGLESQRGLYGELVILRQLLVHHSDHPLIWDCWRGPFSANQDFSMYGIALEVKSSVASSPTMHISSELQLDTAGWKTLALCLVHLNEIRGGPNTLSALIRELLDRSSKRLSIQLAFRAKLLKVGVDQRHYELFSELGYDLRSLTCFHVSEAFPAIRRSTLDNAIGKVNYELSPAACVNHQMDLSAAFDLFRAP